MDAALTRLRIGGFDVRDQDVTHLSPFVRHHVNLLGRYSFLLPDRAGCGSCVIRTAPARSEPAERLPAALPCLEELPRTGPGSGGRPSGTAVAGAAWGLRPLRDPNAAGAPAPSSSATSATYTFARATWTEP